MSDHPESEEEDEDFKNLWAKALDVRAIGDMDIFEETLLARWDELKTKGVPVDDLLAEVRAAKADFLKACEKSDKAQAALQRAKEDCQVHLQKMRKWVLDGMTAWNTAIEEAASSGDAARSVAVWEQFEEWKQECREKMEESPHDEIRAMVALLE